MSDHRGLYDPPSAQIPLSPQEPHHATFSAVPLSPGLPSHPIAPDAQAYLPAHPAIRRRPSLREKDRVSFLDEILPTPTETDTSYGRGGKGLIRRTGAVGVLTIFILVAVWLAATDTGGEILGEGTRGLRHVFGDEAREWAVQVGSGGKGMDTGMDMAEVQKGDVGTEKNKTPPESCK